jgi:hypothetical protein
MFSEISGGVDPNEVTEEAVKPIGFSSLSAAVTRAMPVAWFRKTALRPSGPERSK